MITLAARPENEPTSYVLAADYTEQWWVTLTPYVKPKESRAPLFHLPAPSFRNVICAAALVVAFGLLLALAGAWWWA